MDREAMIAALIFGGSGSGGGGGADAPLVVTFSQSGSNWSCDTSGDDILAAIEAGKRVYGIYLNSVFHLVKYTTVGSKTLKFASVVYTDATSPAKTEVLQFSGQKVVSTWIWHFSALPLPPEIGSGDSGKTLGVVNGSDGTVGWRFDKGQPYYVGITISGAPVGNVYPLSVDKSLLEITGALTADLDVIATGNIGGPNTFQARVASVQFDPDNGLIIYISFSLMGMVGGSPVLGVVEIDTNGATLTMIPLSTAQMTYDSGTQTLAIVDPLA